MRVTHNMLTRNYLRNMQTNMTNLANSNQKLNSQRKFSKASENVAEANRALRVRNLMAQNERNQTSIRDAQGWISSAEDNLRSVNKIMQDVSERIVQGLNGTIAPSELEKVAREVENLQNEVLQISNAQYNNKSLFGAAGNATGSSPFKVNAAGALEYNGTPVDSMSWDAALGKIVDANGAEIPYNNDNYLDIGLGFVVDGFGENAKLDTKTAMKYTISGVEAFGFGTNADGTHNNLFSLLGDVTAHMRSGNMASLGLDLDCIRSASDNLLMNITDLGTRSTFMEEVGSRIDNDMLNLQTVQNNLEAVPLQEEVMYNKDYEMSWMVTLQLGSKILPTSLFDFIR